MRHDEVEVFDLESHNDERGCISVAESHGIPFEIKRVFTITGVPNGEKRGGHALRTCRQVLVCLNGSVDVVITTGGKKAEYFQLDQPKKALYIPSFNWIVMEKFSPQAVVLVMASHCYDPMDYIRNISEFKKIPRHHFVKEILSKSL